MLLYMDGLAALDTARAETTFDVCVKFQTPRQYPAVEERPDVTRDLACAALLRVRRKRTTSRWQTRSQNEGISDGELTSEAGASLGIEIHVDVTVGGLVVKYDGLPESFTASVKWMLFSGKRAPDFWRNFELLHWRIFGKCKSHQSGGGTLDVGSLLTWKCKVDTLGRDARRWSVSR